MNVNKICSLFLAFFVFVSLSNTAFSQVNWTFKDLKLRGDTLDFKVAANIPDNLRLLGLTPRNRAVVAGSPVSFFIKNGASDLKTEVGLIASRQTEVVKNLDVFAKGASYQCSVAFSDLKDKKTIQGILVFVRLNANKKIETQSLNFCFENSRIQDEDLDGIKTVKAGYEACQVSATF